MRMVLTSLVACAVLAACGEEAGRGRAVAVVATTAQAADLARNVAGRRAEVRGLVKAGADPHDYEPRPSDARALADADLVVRSGGEVDGWLEDVLNNAGGDAETVELIRSVRRLGDDPHWWQNPRNGVLAAEALRAALTKADPEGHEVYARNARRYSAALLRLDRRMARCFAAVPRGRRKLVTTHDAFGHLARRYDIEVVGSVIPSLSSQAQPSARETVRLAERIGREGVRTVFPESALNPRLERALAREAGVGVGEALWADTLGPAGSRGDTLAGALAADARAMARGMGVPCVGL